MHTDIYCINFSHQFLIKELMNVIGSLINRTRFLNEIAQEVRKVWPRHKILGARITGTDHLKNGLSINDAIALSKDLKRIGFDYVSISSGGILPLTKMKQKEAFRVDMAKKIKKV